MRRIIPILLLAGALSSLMTLAEEPGGDHKNEAAGPKKYPEKLVGMVRTELLLDEATGLLTYLLRCTSDKPIKIHMESLGGVEIKFDIVPDVDPVKASTDFSDRVFPANNVTFPYGFKAKAVKIGTPAGEEYLRERERERDREKALDRVVELKKDEAVSRSFYLYDTPWFDDLAKKLETKKFKAYRIDPSPFVYTADAEGKPVTDHQIETCNYERAADGSRKKVYYTGGLIFDLARAKKIQALKPAKKQDKKEEE